MSQRPHAFARIGMLRDLERPRQVFSNLTPNWYASIMGTGIVATAAASLPIHVPGLHLFGLVVWAMAAVMLITLTAATALHWRYFRRPRAAITAIR